jgi:hypothetical protein
MQIEVLHLARPAQDQPDVADAALGEQNDDVRGGEAATDHHHAVGRQDRAREGGRGGLLFRRQAARGVAAHE